MALEINLLKSKRIYKADALTEVHGSMKWCVVFADGSHQYFYKIITGSTSQYAGSGGGYIKTHTYLYIAMNTETYKYEPVKHLQHALDAYQAKHGAAIWAQTQTVPQSTLDAWSHKWGQK